MLSGFYITFLSTKSLAGWEIECDGHLSFVTVCNHVFDPFFLVVTWRSIHGARSWTHASYVLDTDVFSSPPFKQQQPHNRHGTNGNFHLSSALQLTSAMWDKRSHCTQAKDWSWTVHQPVCTLFKGNTFCSVARSTAGTGKAHRGIWDKPK